MSFPIVAQNIAFFMTAKLEQWVWFTVMWFGLMICNCLHDDPRCEGSDGTDRSLTSPAPLTTDIITDSDCSIETENHFLKLKCRYLYSNTIFYKCTHQNKYYQVTWRPNTTYFDKICDKDPGFYQVCGHQKDVDDNNPLSDLLRKSNKEILCKDFACQSKRVKRNDWYGLDNECVLCDGHEDCNNTKIDEEICDFNCRINSTKSETVKNKDVCDDECDCRNCADESQIDETDSGSENPKNCKNRPVGMFCLVRVEERSQKSWVNRTVYVEPAEICDGKKQCMDGSDEKGCTNDKNDEFCRFPNGTRALMPSNKCSVPNIAKMLKKESTVCISFEDQLNCPNKEDNILECQSKSATGKDNDLIKVSKYLVDCGKNSMRGMHIIRDNVSFCNDSIDSKCVDLGPSCHIHKHKMCDNKTDCKTRQDEEDDACQRMEDVECVRRVGRIKSKIPQAWVMDNIIDCMDGRDENKTFWKEYRDNQKLKWCGEEGHWTSVQSQNCSNEKYYFCSDLTEEKVVYGNLCDRIPSCAQEMEVCRVARNQEAFFTDYQAQQALASSSVLHKGYCQRGLKNLAFLAGGCRKVNSTMAPPGIQVFGVTAIEAYAPNVTIDCQFLYGTSYVMLSCNEMCRDNSTPCVISKLDHLSCMSEIPSEDRYYTVATNETEDPYVALVLKKEVKNASVFINPPYFHCDTGPCIDYDKVCNLANDCGDWSDEDQCRNQFKCETGDARIPWTEYCDGSVDCADFSDECGSDCTKSRQLIESTFLVVCCWVIGCLASVFNLIAVCSTALLISKESSMVKIANLSLVMFIGVGDLCVGMYLVAVSIVNHLYEYGEKSFCEDQYRWLTSKACSAFGILNTFGSQLSLYSMTTLSMLRVFCIKGSSLKGVITWKEKIGMSIFCFTIVLCAMTVSYIPVISYLENYFVNGLVYFDNPMFIGIYNKEEHISILRAHYGDFRSEDITWKRIRKMIADMFSKFASDGSNTNPVTGKEVSFYGNSGVCLFKFFVRYGDPQKTYAWFVIVQNFICFFVITLSYLLVYIIVSESAKKVTKTHSKRKTSNSSNSVDKNASLNRKITLLVLTDFLCWVPFIVVCALHSFEVIDATENYSLFSIIILPLNSVINPLLYDNSGIMDFVCSTCRNVSPIQQTVQIVTNSAHRVSAAARAANQGTEQGVEQGAGYALNQIPRQSNTTRLESSEPIEVSFPIEIRIPLREQDTSTT